MSYFHSFARARKAPWSCTESGCEHFKKLRWRDAACIWSLQSVKGPFFDIKGTKQLPSINVLQEPCVVLTWCRAPLPSASVHEKQRQTTPINAVLARTLKLLAGILVQTNRPHDAEPLLAETMDLVRKIQGENSMAYLDAVNLLGNAKLAENDLDGALTQYRTTVATYERILPGNMMAVVPEINICNILYRQGKFAEEDAALERAERDCRQSIGEKNVYYGTVMLQHGGLDFTRGDYGQAALRERQALSSFGTSYPADDDDVVKSEVILGTALTRTGQAAEAEPLLRKALADGKNWKPVAVDHAFGNLETGLGECLLAQKRYADAEPLLLSGRDELVRRLGEHDAMSEAATRRLHDLYVAWNKPAEAAHFAGARATALDARTP